MPFNWNSESNIPPRELPQPVPPGEVSYEVAEVANTVNAGGYLSYNTSNKSYDVIYPTLAVSLPSSLNISDLYANVVSINTATINTASINTAFITNATIANGYVGFDPTSNLQISSKHYVDMVAANSTPLGGNIQLLIQAAGDLLVGVSDNVAVRLPIGSAGAILTAGGSSNTGVYWQPADVGSTQTHRGLTIGTNQSGALHNSQIQLVHVDEIVLDDGTKTTTGWDGVIADMSISGAGGLDTGTILPNTCYEVYAIMGSAGKNLLLHRALDRQCDVSHVASIAASKKLNYKYGTGASWSVNCAQSFQVTKNGAFRAVELSILSTGAPTGNCWVTLEPDGGAGNTNGTVLATSRYFDVSRVSNTASLAPIRVRFPFDATSNVVASNTYWAVLHVDYPAADPSVNPNYISLWGDSSTPYANGAAKFYNANTNGWALANSAASLDVALGPSNFYFRTIIEANSTSVVMPSGYTQKCLVSYCSTTPLSVFRQYQQRGRRMGMPYHYTWTYIGAGGVGAPVVGGEGANNALLLGSGEVVNLGEFIPPVPCLVTSYIWPGGASPTFMQLGQLDTLELQHGVVAEAVGVCAAYVAGGSIEQLGPVLAEYNSIYSCLGALNAQLFISSVEF
jgi:hypothetical protein